MGIGLNSAPDEALATKRELADAPPMWQVVLLNDDYTPMEFVILVLQKFFGKGREQAIQIMLRVHNEGRCVCGVYPRDVAATRVVQVCQYAREQQHPLQCIMEQA